MNFLSSYRLQLHKDFKFHQARELINYFEELGISHVYLSPIFESMPGSNHGYDGLDPQKISQDRGGEGEFLDLVKAVEKSELEGFIIDIVPNHLSSSWKNPAWWDVLEKGKASKYWGVFDVKTSDPVADPIVLPVLGKNREAALVSRELVLAFYGNAFALKYYDSYFPLRKESQTSVLKQITKLIPEAGKTLKSLQMWLQDPENRAILEKHLKRFPIKNMLTILEEQFYVLKDWRSGTREINYRRFFDINELIGLRMEDEKVFQWYHKKIFSLMKAHPVIQGLRIDHVDGLTLPGAYLERLHKKAKAVWVEKILGEKESLPAHWPVLGSTGYEFSNISARLFVDVRGLLSLHSHYLLNIDDRWERFHDCVYESKREILDSYFIAEMNYLSEAFYKEAQKGRFKNKFSRRDLAEVIAEVSSSLRVYRTYAQPKEKINSPWLQDALVEAQGRGKIRNRHAYEWFRQVLTAPGKWNDSLFMCIKRWEQITGPVMAKGLEDTALYRYCPLLSLNGVGGEPDWVGDGSREYHSAQQEQLRSFPMSLATTSTHDTKRSEDVRARIHLLSELSEEWTALFEGLLKDLYITHTLHPRVIYFIIETIIGAWPFNDNIDTEFISRIQAYFVKAMRESKTETSWIDVNQEYEEHLKSFVSELLKPKDQVGRDYLARIQAFAKKCAYFGALNSLAVVALKGTSPGVADFYQGTEMWDLSLVDPDNRRPVDYQLRHERLMKIKAEYAQDPGALCARLMGEWSSGEIKLALTWKILEIRKKISDVILKGEYLPVDPQGEKKNSFVSYLRRHENEWLWIIVPRFLGKTQQVQPSLTLAHSDLNAVSFKAPRGAPIEWMNVMTGERFQGSSLISGDLFEHFPIVILRGTV